MLILSIRTDRPKAEIGLFEDGQQLTREAWQAHRHLAETIHDKINGLLGTNRKKLKDIQGIVVFKGPGSFTGLRIGASVANALADGLSVPIVSAGDDDWVWQAVARLRQGGNEQIVLPEYGAPPRTTKPKH